MNKDNTIDDPLDQLVFSLDEKQYAAFIKILENPPPPGEALRRLLTRKPRWRG